MPLAPPLPPDPSPRLRETRFSNPRLSGVGVELLRLAELYRRVPHEVLRRPERVEFALLLVVDRGQGAHQVDFRPVDLAPGRVVAVRPGAVQQWRPGADVDGDVLLIEPQWLQPRAGPGPAAGAGRRLEDWPSDFTLQAREQARWATLAGLLREELAQPTLDELSVDTARELLQSLLLVLARGARQAMPTQSPQDLLCRRLVQEVDRRVMSRPSVADLARRLGTSVSTLGRACQGTLGLSVKALVDRRVALEAQRLLVHTQATAVSIGEQLGFSEPTNFLKFFKRCAGVTPEQFRRAQRQG
ncbi:helix-turn-helix domain-containing protein [Pseudaquabacterium rugosum]|uniref:AraC family transcriptional regulator n=1 Tax=Pseudaquabacterium rugosum TaxID=2984194 RepID=A0ABU9BCL5_9BURK